MTYLDCILDWDLVLRANNQSLYFLLGLCLQWDPKLHDVVSCYHHVMVSLYHKVFECRNPNLVFDFQPEEFWSQQQCNLEFVPHSPVFELVSYHRWRHCLLYLAHQRLQCDYGLPKLFDTKYVIQRALCFQLHPLQCQQPL